MKLIPSFVVSLRFRIAAIYSSILFGLSAIVTGIIYWLLSRNLSKDNEPILQVVGIDIPGGGPGIAPESELYLSNLQQIDRLANEQAIEALRNYSLIALGGLFMVSFVVGWFVAGRTLHPIRDITSFANKIHSSKDLSLRINQGGPDDELKKLADTFDAMLVSLEESFRENVLTLEATVNFVQESSHEIRNPMQIIRTNLQIVQANEEASIKDYEEAIGVVTTAMDRMSMVIANLTQSDYYRFVNKPQSLLDLSVLLKEVSEEFTHPTNSKGIHLKTDAQQVEIMGDHTSLKQAIANLVTNSMESLERSNRESGYIELSATKQNGSALIKVEDNGLGIKPQDQDRIFARNYSSNVEGRGMGLTIVRQIIEAHNGKVEVESDPDIKTIFSLKLPIAVRELY